MAISHFELRWQAHLVSYCLRFLSSLLLRWSPSAVECLKKSALGHNSAVLPDVVTGKTVWEGARSSRTNEGSLAPGVITRHGRCFCLRPALLAALVMAAAMSVRSSALAQAAPPTLEFDIARNGDVVGHHRVTFRREGDRLIVHSELEIEVEVLFLTVYRYQQTREEVWRNDKLIALVSTADDDGTRREIKGAAGPDGMTVTSGKDRWTLPPESVPASFWNISMVTGKGPLVDSLSGRILDHGVVKLGHETVRAGGRDIVATRYRLKAKRPRDVWYDASGRWVKMRTTGRDGSIAEWLLK